MRILLILSVFTLFSCGEDKHQKDTEENRYYSDYKKIYNSYDSVGVDKTVIALDNYIAEFPNAQDAYILKAWVLAKDNKLDEIDAIFNKAISFDSSNISIYQYWVTISLKDSNKLSQAKKINQIGKKIDSNNLFLQNNDTWIMLFENENEKALENALQVIKQDTLNNNLFYNAAAISALQISNDSVFNYYKVLSEKNGFKGADYVDMFKNESITILELYNKL